MSDEREPRTSWTFLTQHARVLLMISRDADVRLRDLAAMCGMTERAARAIVTDLEKAGYLTHSRHGRRNRYQVVRGTYFRHPAEGHHEIAGLLALFADLAPDLGHQPATTTVDHHDEHP